MHRTGSGRLGRVLAVAGALGLLPEAPGRAQSPPPPLHHFQCYEVRPPAAFERTGVALVDGFGTATVALRKVFTLCAPADKNGEDPSAPDAPGHLTSYGVQPAGRFSRVRDQEIVNQLGTLRLDVTKPTRLLVPTAKSLAGPPAVAPDGQLDHFQCYRVKRARGAARFAKRLGVAMTSQFETATLDLVRPLRLCAPVDKNGERPGAEAHPEHLLCYRARSTSGFAPLRVYLQNQFGPQSYQISQRREFCVPSLRNPQATTTTTSSSSTTSPSTSSSTSTTTSTTLPCACGPVERFSFTTFGNPGGLFCGATTDSVGTVLEDLGCDELHLGGGAAGGPASVACDQCPEFYGVEACSGTALTLRPTSEAETSDRTCTSAGCLYHSPTPILNAAVSLCSASIIARDAIGTVDCATGVTFIDLPIAANSYLVGDSITGTACVGGPNPGMACTTDAECGDGGFCPTGFQPCPVCTPDSTSPTGSRCHGANFGPFSPYVFENQPCVPGTTDRGEAHPTSWDCPPPQPKLATLAIAYQLTTGTATTTDPMGQFCRYCRNTNGNLGYGVCSGGLNDGNPCQTPADCPGGGTCGGEVACTSNADCPAELCDDGVTPCHDDQDCIDVGAVECVDAELRERCTQRESGAFGKAAVVTITESGTVPGDLTDLGAHPGGLVSVFCIPPTYSAIVDGVGSVPGPGSVSYRGDFQLGSPGAAFLDETAASSAGWPVPAPSPAVTSG